MTYIIFKEWAFWVAISIALAALIVSWLFPFRFEFISYANLVLSSAMFFMVALFNLGLKIGKQAKDEE